MAGFNLIDWLFGRTNSSRGIQATNTRPYTTIQPQGVAPENDTIRSDGYAPPYHGPDDLDNFGNETPAMRRAYLRLFREEPTLKSAIEGKAENIAALDVTVQPADDKKPDDVRAAKFVEWAVENTFHGWDGLFLNVLKPAFLLGWSCHEIVMRSVDADETAEWDGLRSLKHCRPLNTENLRLQMDAYRQVLGVVNTVRGLGTYPRRKVLLYTHNDLFGNPFGSGDAAAAYKDASTIDAAMRLWGFAIKVYGGPFLIGKYTQKDRRKQLEAALDAARQGGWMSMHKDDVVEVINMATATSFSAFQEKIKKHEERVYMAVRGAYLPFMQGNSQGGESRGSSDTAKSAGSDPKEYLIGLSVCRVINRDLVPHLVTPNFPPGTGMPKVRLGGVNWSETKTQLEVAKGLKELGYEVDPEYLNKVTAMPMKPAAVAGPGAPVPGAGGAGGPGGATPPGGGDPPAGPQPTTPAPAGGGGPAAVPPANPSLPDGGAGNPASQAPAAPSGANPLTPNAPPVGQPHQQATTPAAQQPPPGADSSPSVPPELLSAMTRAAESGDWPAVQRLVNLGRHPEELGALLGDGGGTGDTATFAEWSPHTLSDGTSGWKSSGGLVRKEKPKEADKPSGDGAAGSDKPPTPKRDVIAEAKAAKAGREPARQAARDAWTAAVADPSKVKAEHLPALAEHLRSLTRDELREVNRSLGNRLGGLKEEHVQRLLNAVGFVGPVQAAGGNTPAPPAGRKQPHELTAAEYQTLGPADYGDMVSADGKVGYLRGGSSGWGSNRVSLVDMHTGQTIGHYDRSEVKLIRRQGFGTGGSINKLNEEFKQKQSADMKRVRDEYADVFLMRKEAMTPEQRERLTQAEAALKEVRDRPLEYDSTTESPHKQSVRTALTAGKPVPPEVLADYPDLAETPAPGPSKLERDMNAGDPNAKKLASTPDGATTQPPKPNFTGVDAKALQPASSLEAIPKQSEEPQAWEIDPQRPGESREEWSRRQAKRTPKAKDLRKPTKDEVETLKHYATREAGLHGIRLRFTTASDGSVRIERKGKKGGPDDAMTPEQANAVSQVLRKYGWVNRSTGEHAVPVDHHIRVFSVAMDANGPHAAFENEPGPTGVPSTDIRNDRRRGIIGVSTPDTATNANPRPTGTAPAMVAMVPSGKGEEWVTAPQPPGPAADEPKKAKPAEASPPPVAKPAAAPSGLPTAKPEAAQSPVTASQPRELRATKNKNNELHTPVDPSAGRKLLADKQVADLVGDVVAGAAEMGKGLGQTPDVISTIAGTAKANGISLSRADAADILTALHDDQVVTMHALNETQHLDPKARRADPAGTAGVKVMGNTLETATLWHNGRARHYIGAGPERKTRDLYDAISKYAKAK